MIYPQTLLTVADNTGARKIMCIRVLGGNQKQSANIAVIIGPIWALPLVPQSVPALHTITAKISRLKNQKCRRKSLILILLCLFFAFAQSHVL